MPVPLPERFELDPVLRRQCEDAIREGSKSFLAASLLLPAQIRLATRALYAFCRAADDLVDESGDPGMANSPTRWFILSGLVIHE